MYKVIVTLFCLLVGGTAYCQPDWKLKKNEDSIKVYTAFNVNSDVKLLKVECKVRASMEQLLALLLDVNRQKEWIYNMRVSHLVKMLHPNELVMYSQVNVPWPCSDRDFVVNMTFNVIDNSHAIVESRSIPDWLPQRAGFVRVRQSHTHWEITKLNDNESKVVYILDFNPAGIVPAWLVNMFLTKAPCHSFRKLHEYVKKPEYQNAYLPFMKVPPPPNLPIGR